MTSSEKLVNGCQRGSQLLRADLSEYKAASNLATNERIQQAILRGEKIYHLAFGQSPFPVPEKLRLALQDNAHRNEYLSIAGIERLRKAICGFLKHTSTGIPERLLSPDNILIGDGSKILIYLIMAVTDSEIWLKSPAWTTYLPQSNLASSKRTVQVQSSYETGWKITPEAVEKALVNSDSFNRIFIFNNPCNPSGVVYTEEELRGLAECFRKHHIIAVCDEIYSHLAYEEGSFVSLSQFYPEGCIITSGLSKWASAGGWRIGYAIFPDELSELKAAVTSAASHTYSCCAAPQQYAAAEFMEDLDACTGYIRHACRILHLVSDMCAARLNGVGVKTIPAQGGFYLFPDFNIIRAGLNKRGIFTGQQMCDAILKEASVSLLPGGPNHLREDDELTTRLCFINFDGGEAMKASEAVGLENSLPDDFVDNYCPQTVAAIQSLTDWCKEQMAA